MHVAGLPQWGCLAPCILRVLLWFVRAEPAYDFLLWSTGCAIYVVIIFVRNGATSGPPDKLANTPEVAPFLTK